MTIAQNEIERARAFAQPLIAQETLDTGENTLAHADAVSHILKDIGGSVAMQASSYLVYACEHLNKPAEVIAKAFGDNLATLAVETNKLVKVQRIARMAQAVDGRSPTAIPMAQTAAAQTENVRKMLLAFSRDLRVVMLRLASRLQTLRHFAATKLPVAPSLARESLQVFAPLANRLGIWEIKWELETYKNVALLLDAKRVDRELAVQQLRERVRAELALQRIVATVQGRPKHIYSIVKKMRGKSLAFEQLYDIRALRIVVPDVPSCYAALSWVHSVFRPVNDEFDDYIARPKTNGYQSLHTVVGDAGDLPIEFQIRTQAMHDHAEHGVAAHWAYKEAGIKGYAGVSASGEYDAKIAVLRQLLAWERDLSASPVEGREVAAFDDRIYVLTPEAAIVELPQGATAVDFAYSVHTNLGHRCRGAKVDGAMVPLNTPLKNGQTVEVTVVKEGGPSRDWLNAGLGYLTSHRARAKVRAWFNAQATHETVAKGREAVEKLLQREGKTAIKLDDLASQLGFDAADDLFEVVGKDEFSLRQIEMVLRPPEPQAPQGAVEEAQEPRPIIQRRSAGGGR
jgi:GTP pyrophosphokinase